MSESTSVLPPDSPERHDRSGPRVSVRGTATRVVPPDLCSWNLTAVGAADARSDSIAAVGQAQHALEAALAGLGGVALSVDSMLHPLTWSARSMHTYDDYEFDKVTGQQLTTPRVVTRLSVVVSVRDLSLVSPLSEALAQLPAVVIDNVSWAADSANPAWRSVRSDAIAAAVRKGTDYAAALGAHIVSIEHLADEGLLSADSFGRRSAATLDWSTAAGGDGPGVSLHPVPQVLTASVEARFVITPVSPDVLSAR